MSVSNPYNDTLLIERQLDMLGPTTIGRAITATLRVSPDGDGSDGLSWSTAYQTINAALDAASTDVNAMTLILIAPINGANYYDINVTGQPTWFANVRLQGTMRNFSEIRNTHVSATCILKLTGLAVLSDICFNLHTGSSDGIVLTNGASRVLRCLFNGRSLTGAATALWLDGATQADAKVDDVDFEGHVSYMTALKVDGFARCHFQVMRLHNCLTGIHILNSDSDDSLFKDIDISDCALGIDIDAGNDQHFQEIDFHHCTRNVDDEVGDSEWVDIHGAFPILILPDNLTGTQVNTGAANTYGSDTELLSAASRDNPFRIVAVHMEPSTSEWYQIRFSADSGSTFYDILQFDGTKREGIAAPSGTEFIFNKGTRISASTRDVSGGDNVKVWLEIQEI